MINVHRPDGSKYYLTGCRGRVRSIETQQIITVLPDFTAGSDRWPELYVSWGQARQGWRL